MMIPNPNNDPINRPYIERLALEWRDGTYYFNGDDPHWGFASQSYYVEPPAQQPPDTRQLAPLVFDGDGWLALVLHGEPIAIAKSRPFMPRRYDGSYWRPIDAATAALYRCTLEEIDA